MKTKIKKIFIITITIIILALYSNIYAASANISASKVSAYVGDSVTVSVNVNAAAWNLNVSGNGISGGNITGFNIEGVNQTTTKSYTLNTNSVGTYVISLKGDISDGSTDVTSDISKTVTVTIKEKPVVLAPTPSPTPSAPSNNNTNTSRPSTNVTKPATNTNVNKNNNAISKSSNAYLGEFRIDQPGINPNFSKYVYNYFVTVGEDVDNLEVTAVPEDKNAAVQISGNNNLKEGENIVTVNVIAEDKVTSNIYTIKVTKSDNPEKSNAYLGNILIEDMILNPSFSQDVFKYDLGITKLESLKILAFPSAQNAKVEIIGNENLVVGENNIKIIVTSENGKMQNTYELKVIKEKIEQSILKDIDNNNTSSGIWNAVKENAAILLLYAFVWIEFLQVVYLYERLKKAENVDIINKDNIREEAYVDKVKGIIKRIKIWKKDK